MADSLPAVNRNILIAVDESENALRAVHYVAQMVGGLPGFNATLLHIIPEPEEDYFPKAEDRDHWLENYGAKMTERLAGYRRVLLDAGFSDSAVRVRMTLKFCPSMAKCILQERDTVEYGTIVVGRQGLSRSEEFIFGSISSKIVHHARNCAVWVVG
jgi:nucleotide-binding universal stress UspA family protein